MKIYFLTPGDRPLIAEFAKESDAPPHSAAFDLADGDSTFDLRYALEAGKLVDKFPGKSDDEVAAALQAAEQAKAEELAAQNAPTP